MMAESGEGGNEGAEFDLELWQADIKYPYSAKAVFGPDFLDLLSQSILEPELVELDRMLYTMGVSRETLNEYAYFSDDYHRIRRDLRILARDFAADFCQSGDRLQQYFRQMRGGKDMGRAFDRTLLRAINTFGVLGNAMVLEGLSFRNAFVRFFQGVLIQEFLFRVIHAARRTRDVDFATQLMRFFSEIEMEVDEDHNHADLLFGALKVFHNVYDSNARSYLFTDDDEEVSAEELFAEIAELTPYRKIDTSDFLLGDCRVRFDDDDGGSNWRLNCVCVVHVQFLKNGGSLSFNLIRSDGELYLCGTVISLASVLGNDAYDPMKRKILKLLLDSLRNKEDDIVFPYTETPVEAAGEVREVVEEVVQTWQPYVAEPQQAEEEVVQQPAPLRRYNHERFKGKSCKAVISAFEQFLGAPRRTGGSHAVFTGLTGLNISVPDHGHSDVKTGLLVSILKKSGIDPDAFLELL